MLLNNLDKLHGSKLNVNLFLIFFILVLSPSYFMAGVKNVHGRGNVAQEDLSSLIIIYIMAGVKLHVHGRGRVAQEDLSTLINIYILAGVKLHVHGRGECGPTGPDFLPPHSTGSQS